MSSKTFAPNANTKGPSSSAISRLRESGSTATFAPNANTKGSGAGGPRQARLAAAALVGTNGYVKK